MENKLTGESKIVFINREENKLDRYLDQFHKKYFIEEIVDFDNKRIEERFVCVKCLTNIRR